MKKKAILTSCLAICLVFVVLGTQASSNMGLQTLPKAEAAQQALQITSITPGEVEEETAPITLTIRGAGFTQNSVVQLFYLQEEILKMNLKPAQVTHNEIVVEVGSEWFQALEKVPPSRTKLRPTSFRHIPAVGFSVKVLNSEGQESNAIGVRIKRFMIRISGFSPSETLAIKSGTQQEIMVTVERRQWTGAIPIRISAFEAPKFSPSLTGLQTLEFKQRVGIEGHAIIPPGRNSIRLPIKVAKSVPSGTYALRFFSTLDQCRLVSCEDMQISARISTDVCIYPNCPPTAPSDLAVISIPLPATGGTYMFLRWTDRATNENGYRVYRGLPPDPVEGIYSIEWNQVDELKPNREVWREETKLNPGTYCYYVEAFRKTPDGGELASGSNQACGEIFSPDPPDRKKTPPDIEIGIENFIASCIVNSDDIDVQIWFSICNRGGSTANKVIITLAVDGNFRQIPVDEPIPSGACGYSKVPLTFRAKKSSCYTIYADCEGCQDQDIVGDCSIGDKCPRK